MPTYYTHLNDTFSAGSVDYTNAWDSGFSGTTHLSQSAGTMVMATTGTSGQTTQLEPLFTAGDSTPISPQFDGTSYIYETKVKPSGQRSAASPPTAYAVFARTYAFYNSNFYAAGFQLYSRTGTGSGTTYGLVTDTTTPGSGYQNSTDVVSINVDTYIWLRVTVDGSTGGVKWEYSLNGSTWITARNETTRFYQSTAALNIYMLHQTYGSSGSAANAYLDYVTLQSTEPPVVSYTASGTRGYASYLVNFADTSPGAFTAWSWTFGDGGTSTSQNPSHTYTTAGKYTVTLTATDRVGVGTAATTVVNVPVHVTQTSAISGSSSVIAPTITLHDPPPPAPVDWSAIGQEDKKEYLYKVYDHSGTYTGVWKDVKDEPQFTQPINTPGTTMTVQLSRSANSTIEVRSMLIDESGNFIVDQDGTTNLVGVLKTANSVGQDTDVELNYNVDVYVQYGGFVNLIDQDGNLLVDQDGNQLVATYGSPVGTRIFSGYIMDYTSSYGDTNGVTVTLASHGMELSQEVIRSGTTTTVTYTTTELATIAKSILDTNPGKLTYSAGSIDNTGVSRTLKFELNRKLQGIQSVYEQTPDGWYWYGNVAENNLYLKASGTSADHTFILGQHIKGIDVKRSIESLVNAVWFVGGQTDPTDPATAVYKYYEDTASQTAWRKGVDIITDRRYLLSASMSGRANKEMGRYKNPIFTTPLSISSGRYDIETIKLGQMVQLRNFGNFIDTLLLQIVSLSYTPTAVTLQLGELQDRQVDVVSDIQDDLQNDQFQAIPTAPS